MMRTVIVWWDLSGSTQTIGSLRAYLRDESVAAFAEVPGLRFTTWIADPETNRWGAVLLRESAAAATQPLPSRAAELIGYPPAQTHVSTSKPRSKGATTRSSRCAVLPSAIDPLLTPPRPGTRRAAPPPPARSAPRAARLPVLLAIAAE